MQHFKLEKVYFEVRTQHTGLIGPMKKGRKEMIYLMTHLTHFYLRLYGVGRSDA